MSNETDPCHIDDPGDPDVAGLGVTVSFLATIVLTAISILILYFRSELETHSARYSSVDRAFIRFVTRSKRSQNEEEEEQTVNHKAINVGLWRFLETLSDQQLITGTALAIPVYIRLADRANYSVYSFGMAASTIYLSCLTHMCTLVALGDKVSEKGREWNRIARNVLLILMAPILLISNFPTFVLDPSLSVKCAFEQFNLYGESVTLIFGLQATLILSLVIGGYGRRIIAVLLHNKAKELQNEDELTSTTTPSKPGFRGIPTRLARAWLDRESAKERNVISIESGGWAENQEIRSAILRGREILDPRSISPGQRYPPRTMGQIILLVGELHGSYVWELFWLSFYFNFGIVSIILQWTALPPLSQWSLSFGQLLPIMLLVFGLLPAYSEYRDSKEELLKKMKKADEEASFGLSSKDENTYLSDPEKRSPSKNEFSEEISEVPSGTLWENQQPPQPQQRQQRQQLLKWREMKQWEEEIKVQPLRRELGLYQAIASGHPIRARSVVIPIGILSFLILQFFASILSGAFNTLVVRDPTSWLFVSFLPWAVLSASTSYMIFSFARDNWRIRRQELDREMPRERIRGVPQERLRGQGPTPRVRRGRGEILRI